MNIYTRIFFSLSFFLLKTMEDACRKGLDLVLVSRVWGSQESKQVAVEALQGALGYFGYVGSKYGS